MFSEITIITIIVAFLSLLRNFIHLKWENPFLTIIFEVFSCAAVILFFVRRFFYICFIRIKMAINAKMPANAYMSLFMCSATFFVAFIFFP